MAKADGQVETGITKISVKGYKSLYDDSSIEIRPLTVLAGANSSGKSSIMQPLLLLKQTLEASYDPGALLINGPNVKFTSTDQLISRASGRSAKRDGLEIGLSVGGNRYFRSTFVRDPGKGFSVVRTDFGSAKKALSVTVDLSEEDKTTIKQLFKELPLPQNWEVAAVRSKCFLRAGFKTDGGSVFVFPVISRSRDELFFDFEEFITDSIHLPGLRGNPQRDYPVSAVGESFPGTFEKYSASVIMNWQETKNKEKLHLLFEDLKLLGLTWKVVAKPINETQVELHVGRLLQPVQGGARDWVSIADVGFGVSQTLPVLVALHAARPGQLVYIEQPEIHLHPRAQSAMARVLVNAAKRGARVVVETHSSLLLLGIQTLVAEGDMPSENVKFHWFTRSPDGPTKVEAAELDDNGTYGTWPEDFADVALEAEDRFLNAAGGPGCNNK